METGGAGSSVGRGAEGGARRRWQRALEDRAFRECESGEERPRGGWEGAAGRWRWVVRRPGAAARLGSSTAVLSTGGGRDELGGRLGRTSAARARRAGADWVTEPPPLETAGNSAAAAVHRSFAVSRTAHSPRGALVRSPTLDRVLWTIQTSTEAGASRRSRHPPPRRAYSLQTRPPFADDHVHITAPRIPRATK